MIKFLVGGSKMLRILVIFPLLFVAIRASGEFSVLSSPESITFTGSDILQSQYIGDVFNAAVGNSIPGDAQWTGMTIIDPFDLATGVIVVYVDGTNQISVDSSAKTYSMAGNDADDSLNVITSELGASNAAVCDVNFNEFEEGVVSYRSCFGDMDVPVIKAKSLNPALHSADKQFLQSISFIDSASDNLAAMQAAANFVFFRLSLEPISKAHGEKSEAMAEATNMIEAAVSKLNASIQKSSKKNVLVVAITNKSDGGRFKRQGEPTTGTSTDGYNLATYYNEDYPVIFNIILWFMVTFGFSLLAICYAIGTMDPGRDSIIYRMTSTRMKKDN